MLNKFEREGTTKSCNMANFVDLDAITAGMDGEEALKPQRDGGGCPEFDFLLVDKEKADIFELVAEMGGLGDNLHDGTEILHQKGLSYGKKGVRVEDGAHSTPKRAEHQNF